MILFLPFLLLSQSVFAQEQAIFFKKQETTNGYCYHIVSNNKIIGQLCSYEIKFLNTVILHSIYVDRAHRGQGIAYDGLRHVLNDYQQEGYQSAYIQVGPFEFDQPLQKDTLDYQKRVLQIEHLYRRVGFEIISYPEQFLASLIYTVIGLDHETRHLLRYEFKKHIA